MEGRAQSAPGQSAVHGNSDDGQPTGPPNERPNTVHGFQDLVDLVEDEALIDAADGLFSKQELAILEHVIVDDYDHVSLETQDQARIALKAAMMEDFRSTDASLEDFVNDALEDVEMLQCTVKNALGSAPEALEDVDALEDVEMLQCTAKNALGSAHQGPAADGVFSPVQPDAKANDQCAGDEPGLPFTGIIIDAPQTFLGTAGVPADVTGAELKELFQRTFVLDGDNGWNPQPKDNPRIMDKYSILAHTAQVLDPVVDRLGVRPMLRVEKIDPLSVLLKRKGLEDVFDRDMAGRTALHHAAFEGNLGQVLITLDAGAEVDALDTNLFSPLHLAAFHGHESVVHRLLKSKADPRRINYQGKTAGELAEHGGHDYIAAYFRGKNPGFPTGEVLGLRFDDEIEKPYPNSPKPKLQKKKEGVQEDSLARRLAKQFEAQMEEALRPFQYDPTRSQAKEEKAEETRAENEVPKPEGDSKASSNPKEKPEVISTGGILDFQPKRKRKRKTEEEASHEALREPPAFLLGWPHVWDKLDNDFDYTKEQGRQFYMIFRQALHEGDGEVDKHQLPLVIKTLGYLLCDKQAIQNISEEITHYGTLDWAEFLKFVRMYDSFERAKWQAHFDKFDEDKSGEVSVDELKLVLTELGYTPLPEMLDEALKEVDDDGSGTINLHEFMALIEQYKTTQGFTKDELESMEDLFVRFDRDEDEFLDSKDMYYLKRYLGLKGVEIEEDEDMRPLGWNGFLAEMRRNTEAEIAFFRKEFEAHDADKSGHIDTTELVAVLENLGFTALKKMLDEILAIVDKDGSNELDFFEFNRMMWYYRRSEGFCRAEIAELAEVFGRYDKDKSEEISIMELGDVLRYLGHTPNVTRLRTLVEEFDIDGSGDVGLTEFLKIMRIFREEEIKEFKFVFKKYDKDKSGSLATKEIAQVLRYLGREVSEPIVEAAIAEVDLDGSGELDWNEFVALMDKYRKMDVEDKRNKCGFHDAEIFHYKTSFQAVDKDGSDDLNAAEINRLLTDLNMAPRTPEEQKHVVQLLEECRKEAGVQDGKTTFFVFLRLMRFLEDEKDKKALEEEQKAVEESKFSMQEVNEFREIFKHQASNDAISGLPGARKGGKSLGPEGVHRMLHSLGLKPTADEKEQLFKMIEEADQDGNGNVDFPDFLILFRRLMDVNFCGLNPPEEAEEAAT